MDTEQSDVYEQLMGAVLRFVSFRPRSEKEIREYLGKKLHRSHTTAPIVLEKVLARLRELGYADDVKFAAWWVGQRTGRKPKGRKLIERELAAKGIQWQVIVNEKELARQAVEKKLDVWKTLSHFEQKKKISEFLYRRGFDWDAIGSIVDEVMGKE